MKNHPDGIIIQNLSLVVLLKTDFSENRKKRGAKIGYSLP